MADKVELWALDAHAPVPAVVQEGVGTVGYANHCSVGRVPPPRSALLLVALFQSSDRRAATCYRELSVGSSRNERSRRLHSDHLSLAQQPREIPPERVSQNLEFPYLFSFPARELLILTLNAVKTRIDVRKHV